MKKIFSFLTAILFVGSMWATVVDKTINTIVSDSSYTVSAGQSVTCYTSFPLDEYITISTSGSANCGSFWGTTTKDWRLYQNKSGNITIAAAEGYSIDSVTITYGQSNSGTLKDGSTTIASATRQLIKATSKTYTVGNTGSATNGQVKVTRIRVVYSAEVSCKSEVTVTPGETEHGSFTLSDTKVCADGAGGEITITEITPDAGYELDGITATVGVVDAENLKVTGITAATTITVTFKALPKYTVSFSTGVTATQAPITETLGGQGITLPDAPEVCETYTFAGWSEKSAGSTETTAAQTLLAAGANYKPAANITLYAVYSRVEPTDGSAAVGTTLYAENFSGFEADDVPSSTTPGSPTVYGSGSVTYSVTNGKGTTKIYTGDMYAGGEEPELLVGKSNGSFSISDIPTGLASVATLTYKTNKTSDINVTTTTENVSIGNVSVDATVTTLCSRTITFAADAATDFDLTFTQTGSANARLDDITLKVTSNGTIYFISVPNCTTTAIDNTEVSGKAVKSIVNGQLIIEKNGHVYNAMGQIIK